MNEDAVVAMEVLLAPGPPSNLLRLGGQVLTLEVPAVPTFTVDTAPLSTHIIKFKLRTCDAVSLCKPAVRPGMSSHDFQ